MERIKAISCGLLLAALLLGNLSFGRKFSYQYSVTGYDPYNGNYIVTTDHVQCVPIPMGPCSISSTIAASLINGQWEVTRATATVLSQGITY